MKFKILKSGSKGNANLITYKNTTILLDGGYTTKKALLEDLENINIDAILITHNHTDHASNVLGKWAYENNIPIYMNKLTYFEDNLRKKPHFTIPATKTINERRCMVNEYQYNNIFEIGDIKIEIIRAYHDINGCNGYIFNDKLGYLTDTGFIDNNVKKQLLKVTDLAIEFNYDLKELMWSDRHSAIKNRTLLNIGHLENKETFKFLKWLKENGNIQTVYPMHISNLHNSIEKIEELKSNFFEDDEKEKLIFRYERGLEFEI